MTTPLVRNVLGAAGLGAALAIGASLNVQAQTEGKPEKTELSKAEKDLRDRIVGVWSLLGTEFGSGVSDSTIINALKKCRGAELFKKLTSRDENLTATANAQLPASVVYFLDKEKLTRIDIGLRAVTPIDNAESVQTNKPFPVWKLTANKASIAVFFAGLRLGRGEIPVMFENETAYVSCKTRLNKQPGEAETDDAAKN